MQSLLRSLRQADIDDTIRTDAASLSISPPEVLENPKAPRTTAGDVYAFGVLMVEVLTGSPALAGVPTDEVARAVKTGNRPAIPGDIPADVASLITACWAQDAAARPTFAEIVAKLNAATAELQSGNCNEDEAATTLADLTAWRKGV